MCATCSYKMYYTNLAFEILVKVIVFLQSFQKLWKSTAAITINNIDPVFKIRTRWRWRQNTIDAADTITKWYDVEVISHRTRILIQVDPYTMKYFEDVRWGESQLEIVVKKVLVAMTHFLTSRMMMRIDVEERRSFLEPRRHAAHWRSCRMCDHCRLATSHHWRRSSVRWE